MVHDLKIAIEIIIDYSLNYYLCVPCFREAAADDVLFISLASFSSLELTEKRRVDLFASRSEESWDAGIKKCYLGLELQCITLQNLHIYHKERDSIGFFLCIHLHSIPEKWLILLDSIRHLT